MQEIEDALYWENDFLGLQKPLNNAHQCEILINDKRRRNLKVIMVSSSIKVKQDHDKYQY